MGEARRNNEVYSRRKVDAMNGMNMQHNEQSGESLIATAGAVAVALAKTMDNEEITTFCELLGLVKHNLEVIKFRRFFEKKH